MPMADIIPFPKRGLSKHEMTDAEMMSVGRRICAEIDQMVEAACPSRGEADRAAAWQAIAAGVILSLISQPATAGGIASPAPFA